MMLSLENNVKELCYCTLLLLFYLFIILLFYYFIIFDNDV